MTERKGCQDLSVDPFVPTVDSPRKSSGILASLGRVRVVLLNIKNYEFILSFVRLIVSERCNYSI